jgi:hypothetical protein
MPLDGRISCENCPASASAEHRPGRLAPFCRLAVPAVALAWAVLTAWGPARTSVAEEATNTAAPAPEATAEQAHPSMSEKQSGAFFGQFLETIDDFYNHDTQPEEQKSPTANHEPQTGTLGPQAIQEKSIKEETEALVRDALPQPQPQESQESKASPVGRASNRVVQIGPKSSPSKVPVADQQSGAPRWARGGLLGSLFGDDQPQEDQAAERMAQRPTQQAAPPSMPQPSLADRSNRQVPSDNSRMAAKPAGAAESWMSKLVSPLFKRPEPTEQQASAPSVTTHQPSASPITRQASTPPATRPVRHMPMAHPEVNQPLARSRPDAVWPAHSNPSMEPSVAIQFGQKDRRSTPSHAAQSEMQLAQSAPPSARQGQVAQSAPPAQPRGNVMTGPRSATDDITPIVEGQVATTAPPTATPESALSAPPVDLTDVLQTVEATTSHVAAMPTPERTPTLADEYAHAETGPAEPPTKRSDMFSPEASDGLLQELNIASIQFASSSGVLGLAELTNQGGNVNSTKPSTEGGPVGRPPAIEVARQPRLVR